MDKKFSFFHHFLNLSSDEILISYKGPMTSPIMYEISKDIEDKIFSDPKVGKKIYAIFMELAQNILNYSAESNKFSSNDERVGSIVITQSPEFYTLITGNIVDKKWVPSLLERCKLINSLDREGLRKLKFEQRFNPKLSENSKGAGVGLIQIALTAEQALEVDFRDLGDDKSFFSLTVNVKRNNN